MPNQIHFNVHETSKRFIEIRTQNGMTQEELSKSLEVALQTIKNYEKAGSQNVRDPINGDRINAIAGMKIETLFKMAKKFNVSADYLLGLSDIATPNLNVQEMHKMTGLTEENVTSLINHGPYGKDHIPQLHENYKNLVNDLISFASAHHATRKYSHFLSAAKSPEPRFPLPPEDGNPAMVSYKVVAEILSGTPEDGVDYAEGHIAISLSEYSSILLDGFLYDLKAYLRSLYFGSVNGEVDNGND